MDSFKLYENVFINILFVTSLGLLIIRKFQREYLVPFYSLGELENSVLK